MNRIAPFFLFSFLLISGNGFSRELADGTISYLQPESTGFLGAEGKCFQTAAANVCSMLDPKNLITPEQVDASIVQDPTPGTLPLNGLDFLKNYCLGDWELVRLKHDSILSLKKYLDSGAFKSKIDFSPVILLLSWSNTLTSLHWITIVGYEKDKFLINHWGARDSLTSDELLERWSMAKIPGADESQEFLNEFSYILLTQKAVDQ